MTFAELKALMDKRMAEGWFKIQVMPTPTSNPHAYDHACGMQPMSGTSVTERTTKKWPAGEFPRRAMR